MTIKLYRATLIEKADGARPIFVQICAPSKKQAVNEAKRVAEGEKALYRSIVELKT